MPSSFTRVLSSALGYSPRPPVSDLVRSPRTLPNEVFLGRSSSQFATRAPRSPELALADFPTSHPRPKTGIYQPDDLRTAVTPRCKRLRGGAGMLTCFPSATPFGLVLGTDSPWAELPCPGNLRLTARRILIFFIATHPGRITWTSSRSRYRLPSSVRPTLPYQCARPPGTVRGFGSALSPVNFRRRVARLVSCYALFK